MSFSCSVGAGEWDFAWEHYRVRRSPDGKPCDACGLSIRVGQEYVHRCCGTTDGPEVHHSMVHRACLELIERAHLAICGVEEHYWSETLDDVAGELQASLFAEPDEWSGYTPPGAEFVREWTVDFGRVTDAFEAAQ